jgi:hypothetical protein
MRPLRIILLLLAAHFSNVRGTQTTLQRQLHLPCDLRLDREMRQNVKVGLHGLGWPYSLRTQQRTNLLRCQLVIRVDSVRIVLELGLDLGVPKASQRKPSRWRCAPMT